MGSLPPFATGEIVGSYELLYVYWRKAGRRASDATLRNEDFELLREIVEREGLRRVEDIVDRLVDHFASRVDPEAARIAVEEYYNTSVEPALAQKMVARILAGWLVEAGKEWKMYSFTRRLPRD